jgi:hypothetical protein
MSLGGLLLQVRVRTTFLSTDYCNNRNVRFCGSTDDFCDVKKDCQKDFGGCGPPKRPSCGKDGTSSKTI